MKIRVTKHAGFCMGVKRALETVLKERQGERGRLFTYGPIIHNHQVLELLEKKHIHVFQEGDGISEGTVVIRAHGVPPDVKQRLRARGLKVVEGTCPKVRWVQGLVRKYVNLGRDVVILGEKDHPEVIGLVGYGMGRPYVIQGPSDVKGLPSLKDPVLLAQTTQERERFAGTEKALREIYPDLVVFDTICETTKERQEEVRELARRSEVMVVVGGRHSGNTARLAEVAKATGKRTYLVETEKEIEPKWFEGVNSVGVTAGASTPNWMIIRVLRRLEEINSQKESFLSRGARAILRCSFYTGVLAALSLASVLIGIQVLTKASVSFVQALIVSLLFDSFLITARYVDRESLSYNDPNMYRFLVDYRMGVMAFGGASLLVGLYLCYRYLTLAHVLVGIFMFLGVLGYRMQKRLKMAKAFSLPGIRSLGEAIIFATLSGPFIFFENWIRNPSSAWVPVVLCLSFGFARSLFQDILHFQGDLIVGDKSLSVVLGDEKLMKCLFGVCLFLVVFLFALAFYYGIWAFPLLFSSLLFFAVILAYQKRVIIIPSRAEILSDLAIISTCYFVFVMKQSGKFLSWIL